jgi:AcrR family transcriptional regulator
MAADNADDAAPSGAREALMLAAERLYSELGPSVALRDIAKESGQRNNAAVSYHFGSRDGLVEAILNLRSGAMENARLALLAGSDPGQLGFGDLVHILVEPMLVTPYKQGSTHYARFLEAIRSQHQIVDDDRWRTTRRILGMIEARLDDLPQGRRRLRTRSLGSSLFAIAADLERDREKGRRLPAVSDVVQMLTGLVTAGSSAPGS